MRTLPNQSRHLDIKSRVLQKLYQGINKLPITPSEHKYNITINHEKKFLWFRVAKVGTRTIFSHLKNNNIQLDVEHASYLNYPVKSYKDYFKFAFIRNPWDRLVSCWYNKVIEKNYYNFDAETHDRMKNFDNFIDYVATLDIFNCERHLCAQTALIDINNVDYLGRMETFTQDINYIFNHLNINTENIISKNVTKNRKPYHGYYTEKLAEKVYQIYKKDIQVFGYNF